MIFELKEKKDKELEKMHQKAMKELNKFFEIDWRYNQPNIFLVKNRKTIDILLGKKTKNWVIAWSDKRDIFLLDKKNIEKESCHKYSKETFENRIKHELAHSFFEILSKGNVFPLWLNEGVGTYVAKQDKEIRFEKFERFLKFYSNWELEGYGESYLVIKLLIKNFGKTKLLKLIKSLSKIKSEKEFNSLFNKIYQSFPTYKFFNQLLKNENN
jgi:hypothetical protein